MGPGGTREDQAGSGAPGPSSQFLGAWPSPPLGLWAVGSWAVWLPDAQLQDRR